MLFIELNALKNFKLLRDITTEETRVEEKRRSFSALSVGAYTITWLVRVTLSPGVVSSKLDF